MIIPFSVLMFTKVLHYFLKHLEIASLEIGIKTHLCVLLKFAFNILTIPELFL